MIIPDTNLILYATDELSPHHGPARRWWVASLSSTETLGMPWVGLLAFVRLATKAAVISVPLTVTQALDLVDGWLAQPNVTIVAPGRRHASILRQLLEDIGTGGNLTTDAHLAALAIEHGAEIHSADADFGRFAGLRCSNPLRP